MDRSAPAFCLAYETGENLTVIAAGIGKLRGSGVSKYKLLRLLDGAGSFVGAGSHACSGAVQTLAVHPVDPAEGTPGES